MRVVVVGATGNVGTSVVRALAGDDAVSSVLGLARREPPWRPPKTAWAAVDVASGDLTGLFRSADAVVHLAWLFQPTRDPVTTWRVNVLGSDRVFRAVSEAQVPALVYVSSVGAYSPGSKDRRVDESWPTHGWPTAAYTREKAYVERILDSFEREDPSRRVVRLRPGFMFQRASAAEQRRLFAGPLVPHRLLRPGLVPVVPDIPGLRFQALHTDDAGEAVRLAVTHPVSGTFNLAAEPVLDPAVMAAVLGARTVRLPAGASRAALAAAWHLRLLPASPQLFDAVLRMPLMDASRARTRLGWSPRHSAVDALREVLEGFREGTGGATPPLSERVSGRFRGREITTGVGRRP